MRVLHIARKMGQGGAEKVIYQLCKDNKEANQYVASCGGIYVNSLKAFGVEHLMIPDIDRKNPLEMLKTLFVLNEFISKNKIELIHTHHRMAAFYGRILQIFHHNLRHVYTAHNVFHRKKALLRFALKKASIVACGKSVEMNLIDEYKIEKKKIHCIYNCIEAPTKIVNITEFDKSEKLVGVIGRLSEEKGIDVFIKALQIVIRNHPNLKGVIIGDGECRVELEEMANTLGLGNNVLFIGYRKDVFSLIKRMEFIVFPSRYEGFPLTPIETFSVGRTIIVSDIPSNLEIVEDGFNGISFRKDDYTDLACKISKLLEHEELRTKLEFNAAEDYKKRFDYSVFIKNYQELYKHVIANR